MYAGVSYAPAFFLAFKLVEQLSCQHLQINAVVCDVIKVPANHVDHIRTGHHLLCEVKLYGCLHLVAHFSAIADRLKCDDRIVLDEDTEAHSWRTASASSQYVMDRRLNRLGCGYAADAQ